MNEDKLTLSVVQLPEDMSEVKKTTVIKDKLSEQTSKIYDTLDEILKVVKDTKQEMVIMRPA